MGIFDSLSGILDSGNHDSILGAVGKPIQKWTDPLSWATGGKWADWTSTDIPRASNQALSKVMTPFDRVDETINPVRRYVPGVDQLGDVVRDKPASAIGTAVGAMFGGGAALGAMGAGGAGGAGAGGAGAAGGGSGGGLFSGILGGGGAAGGGGGLGTGLASGGSAAGYGGGVSSSVLPGIFEGATVAPQGAAGVGSFSGGMGGLGAFGGGAGTGSITGAGSSGGLGLNSSGIDWMQLAQQGQKMMNQNQQQQQGQQPSGMGMGGGGGGGGGGNMRGLFSALMQKPMSPAGIHSTAGLLNLKGY